MPARRRERGRRPSPRLLPVWFWVLVAVNHTFGTVMLAYGGAEWWMVFGLGVTVGIAVAMAGTTAIFNRSSQ